ncbi:MAG: PRC-barrel domain-containing protein [Thermoplasmata archaeon]|nr:MAG: PRC-barrel domain-containing protein [Thermoplasmata archaeon]
MPIKKDTDLYGKRVILEDASDVGTLADIYVDTSDWRMTHLDIRLEKRYTERLGMEKALLKKPVITVPIHLLMQVEDVVHLKGDIDDLAKTQKTILPAAEKRMEEERAAEAAARAAKAPAKPKKGKDKKKKAPAPAKPPPEPKMPPKKDKPRSI